MSYSRIEKKFILDLFQELGKKEMTPFLVSHGLRTTGTKAAIRKEVENGLVDRRTTYASLVRFIDRHSEWDKQHVYVLNGPAIDISRWRDRHSLHDQMPQMVKVVAGSPAVRILPEELSLQSVASDGSRLRLVAVERQEYRDRRPELDADEEVDGKAIHYKAYEDSTWRGVMAFEWDMVANVAIIQISQMSSASEYEDARQRLVALVGDWIPFDHFRVVDMRRVIKNLHAQEEGGSREVRLQEIDYSTQGGRRFAGKSAANGLKLLGEAVTDDVMRQLRNAGEGRIANAYWLKSPPALMDEVHVILVAESGRVNFTTHNDEAVVRHVLGRIRHHS